jgi:hypothetical protein
MTLHDSLLLSMSVGNGLSVIEVPILKGVRFLSAIKSLGDAAPTNQKVKRLYLGLLALFS